MSDAERNLFHHGDAALRHLIEAASEDADMIEMAGIALAHLDHTTDERIATSLVVAILLNDNLAEALHGSLDL